MCTLRGTSECILGDRGGGPVLVCVAEVLGSYSEWAISGRILFPRLQISKS